MRTRRGRAGMRAALSGALLLCAAASWAAAEPPAAPATAAAQADSELLARARAALASIAAFERLNQQIIRLCGDPLPGSYADWRDDFHDDLERARALGKALGAPPPAVTAAAERATEPTLEAFRSSRTQELDSRCMRWGTALIQHESRVRAEIAAEFAFLKANEPAIRAALAH
jgi:hypothetical protein